MLSALNKLSVKKNTLNFMVAMCGVPKPILDIVHIFLLHFYAILRDIGYYIALPNSKDKF